MFYVTYSDYDEYHVVATFSHRKDAEVYAAYLNFTSGFGYHEVEDFSDVPINPKIEGAIVLRKGAPYKHFRELEEAEKWISKRKNPADYEIHHTGWTPVKEGSDVYEMSDFEEMERHGSLISGMDGSAFPAKEISGTLYESRDTSNWDGATHVVWYNK